MIRRIAEYVMTAACNLVCASVVIVVTIAVASWLRTPVIGEADGGVETARGGVSSSPLTPLFETNRVKMKVSSDLPCAEYRLEDEQGREVLRVTYGRRGFVIVNLGEMFPIRPGFSAELDGTYDFSLIHEGVDHRLKVRPQGVSGFKVASHSHRPSECNCIPPITAGP